MNKILFQQEKQMFLLKAQTAFQEALCNILRAVPPSKEREEEAQLILKQFGDGFLKDSEFVNHLFGLLFQGVKDTDSNKPDLNLIHELSMALLDLRQMELSCKPLKARKK